MLTLAAGAEKVVPAMVTSFDEITRRCIILDAGHGFPDGGAISCTGVAESEINLNITKKLDAVLRLMGYNTKMLRSTNDSIYTQGHTIAQKKISDLKERVRIINETPDALLISIHQNTFSDSRYCGAQVFYAETKYSNVLANQLQENLVSLLNPGSNRKCKLSKGVYLMEHIECTGVLIECGFISNPEEEAKLQNEEYQKRLSMIIASAVSTFMSNT